MLGEPGSQPGLSDFTRREAQKGQAGLFLAGNYGDSIELKEYKCDLHRGSFVPVDEGMIAGDAHRVRRGQICHGQRALGVGEQILGTSQSGVQKTPVPDPIRAAK